MRAYQADLALLVVACFGRHPEALAWGRERLEAEYGPVVLTSPEYDFHHTKYYEGTMGPGLRKQLLAFQNLVAADRLADIKVHTNRLELELAESGRFAETRPLNLDPGLLELGKFMLATTKDQAHRIYLRSGIYAEVTLRFQAGMFEPWPWTYADYREPAVREALVNMREFYRNQLASVRSRPEQP